MARVAVVVGKAVRPVLLAALLGLGACGRSPEAPDRTVRIGQDTDVLSLDPTYAEVVTFSTLSNVFEPLVGYDAHLSVVPVLATTWSTPDAYRWLFELRPGVRFQDGTPLDAAAVAKALERVRTDPASGVKGLLWAVEESRAVGELQLEIRTREPDALLLHELTHVLVAARDGAGRLVGTGPYRIVRWVRGKVLRLEASAGYWGELPAIRAAELVPVPEGEASLAAVREGRVDVVEIPASSREPLPTGWRASDSPGLTTYFLSLPTGGGTDGHLSPLADGRVRQAVALALDRRALAARVAGSPGFAAEQVVPKSIFGYEPLLEAPPFDLEAARRLLAEAGVRGRMPLTIVHRDAAVQAAIARELVPPLTALGCDVTLRPMAWGDLVDTLRRGRLPVALWSWDYDNGDAGSFLRDVVHTRDETRGLGAYNPGFSSAEADRLITAATAAFEPTARRAIYGKLMRLVREEASLIPLFHPPHVYASGPGLEFVPRLDDRFLVAEMSWTEKAPPD